MKNQFPLIFLLVTQICMSQKSAAPALSLQKLDENSSQISQDSLLKIKKIKRELATIKLLKLQDSLLRALAVENKIEAERLKNALPRTEYYKNGQNGIELIVPWPRSRLGERSHFALRGAPTKQILTGCCVR